MIQKFRLLLILASIAIGCFASYAQSTKAWNNIVVRTTDGRSLEIALARDLSATVTNGETLKIYETVFNYDTGEQERIDHIEVPITQVSKMEFYDSPGASVNAIQSDLGITPDFTNGTLFIRGNISMTVYDATGRILGSETVSGPTSIDLNKYGKGLLLVSAQGITLKFLVR